MIALFAFIFIAGVAKAGMDTLQFHYSKSIFNIRFVNEFWDASISWKNKYSDTAKLIRKKWLSIIPTPVFLTDGWHLFQFIFLNSLFVAISIHTSISSDFCFDNKILRLCFDFTILRSIFGLSFAIFYKKFFLK